MKLPRFTRKSLCIPYAVFLVFFVIVPMLVIVFYAFTDQNNNISFSNFIKFFSDPTKLSTIVYSLVIALVTTVICLLIAYPIACILARSKLKKKFVILMLFVVPMWINFVLRINALREIFNLLASIPSEGDWWGSWLTGANYFKTVVGMVYDFLPFMILPLYTTMMKIDNSLYEASADLGGNALTAFTRITLPLSMPGIMSGVTMVFLPSMTNYVVSDMLGNAKVTIIGKFISNYFGNDWHMGSMVALVLLVIVFVSTWLSGGFKAEDNVRGTNL